MSFSDHNLFTARGDEIYKILRTDNLTDPEFDQYAEDVRRLEHPTPEEIQQDEDADRKTDFYARTFGDDYRTIGKYQIKNETGPLIDIYPRKYSVRFPSGEVKSMTGIDIYKMLRSENLTDPKLDKYAEDVRRLEHPTPEEIQQDKDAKLEQERRAREASIINQEYAKLRVEEERLTQLYKASNVIEKLKQRHNITDR